MRLSLLLPCLSLLASCQLIDGKQPGSAEITSANYRVFQGDGTPATLEELLDASRKVDVTFLGEIHDDPVAHHLEEAVLRTTRDEHLALSLEVFERDVQYVLDEYLAGHITEAHLRESARAWDNYDSDYRPLVEFAREKDMPVIAANAPRRYVNMVSRLGDGSLMQLSEQALAWLPPLPYAAASPAYAEKFLRLMEENRRSRDADTKSDSLDADSVQAEAEREAQLQRSLRAQSLWDASMAHAIARRLQDQPGSRIVHINGSFHSAQGLGIPDHLALYRPGTTTLVVTMTSSISFPAFDATSLQGQGDFVIVTDPAMQATHGR